MIKAGQLYKIIDGLGIGETISIIEKRRSEWLVNTDIRPAHPDFLLPNIRFEREIANGNYKLIYDPDEAKLQKFEPISNERLSSIE